MRWNDRASESVSNRHSFQHAPRFDIKYSSQDYLIVISSRHRKAADAMRANDGLSFFRSRFASLALHRSTTPDSRCEDDVTELPWVGIASAASGSVPWKESLGTAAAKHNHDSKAFRIF
jgi:hypothetical protein